MSTVTIYHGPNGIDVRPDPVKCSVDEDGQVSFEATPDVKDWRVIFGTYAPVELAGKVASPDSKVLKLKKNRPEDLGHWKYVVVGLSQDGQLSHKDPEMIVDS
jgi:hypothetical protein